MSRRKQQLDDAMAVKALGLDPLNTLHAQLTLISWRYLQEVTKKTGKSLHELSRDDLLNEIAASCSPEALDKAFGKRAAA